MVGDVVETTILQRRFMGSSPSQPTVVSVGLSDTLNRINTGSIEYLIILENI
jgi:hypothetical protein